MGLVRHRIHVGTSAEVSYPAPPGWSPGPRFHKNATGASIPWPILFPSLRSRSRSAPYGGSATTTSTQPFSTSGRPRCRGNLALDPGPQSQSKRTREKPRSRVAPYPRKILVRWFGQSVQPSLQDPGHEGRQGHWSGERRGRGETARHLPLLDFRIACCPVPTPFASASKTLS